MKNDDKLKELYANTKIENIDMSKNPIAIELIVRAFILFFAPSLKIKTGNPNEIKTEPIEDQVMNSVYKPLSKIVKDLVKNTPKPNDNINEITLKKITLRLRFI